MCIDYLNFLAEPSPLHTTTIVEKCTLKLVDEYKHMLCQATEPLSTFLEYITYVILLCFIALYKLSLDEAGLVEWETNWCNVMIDLHLILHM